MRRTIVQPPDLAGAALGELKSWLGISRPGDDAMLTDLLEAGLAMCEAFTGQTPLIQTVEETAHVSGGYCALAARPVQSLLSVEKVENGDRIAIAPTEYDIAIDAQGKASLSFTQAREDFTVAARFTTGLAADWASLAAPLRQGIIRLAAHYYRERDRPAERKSDRGSSSAPASVTALWRPWRTVRLG